MSKAVPVWVWLPGSKMPVLAAELECDDQQPSFSFRYRESFLPPNETVAIDPIQLRLRKGTISIPKSNGLPFVVMDAKPAGYGQDRLIANAGRDLSAVELLELGPSDSVGAIEVCNNIDRKLAWLPKPFSQLAVELERLEENAPSSRAIRRVNGDVGTSAGGERPKATFQHGGRQWLVKMQDRGDLPCMPAREFVAMSLAQRAGLDVPEINLITHGAHQVFMIARFDREGDPNQPERKLFASAQTVLQLEPSALRGDPRRSYLHLADRMRMWGVNQTQELWRRMVFNALVGNTDDHPRNHGLLRDGDAWRLSPAFDITPVFVPQEDRRLGLAMATGADGGGDIGIERLLMSASHFGVESEEGAQWLTKTAFDVAHQWENLIRDSIAPLSLSHQAQGAVIESMRGAFEFASTVINNPAEVEQTLDRLKAPKSRRRTNRRP